MRKNKYLYFFLFALQFLLTFCNMSNYSENLSDGAIYVSGGSTDHYIYKNIQKNKDTITQIEIPANVFNFDYNSDFIIAIQVEFIDTSQNNKELRVKELNEYKKNINFWIIENKTNQLFGPLNSNEYYNKRNELKIPESVKLKL